MSLRAHVDAYQAQWIRRYLEPGDQPWKLVLDHWLSNQYGRGTLIAKFQAGDTSWAADAPYGSYISACLTKFEALKLNQDTTILDHHVIGEPIFHSWRFDLPDITTEIMNRWKNDIAVERVKDVIDEATKNIFTDETMRDWVDSKAPLRVKRTQGRHEEWIRETMETWPQIKRAITKAITESAEAARFVWEFGVAVAHVRASVEVLPPGSLFRRVGDWGAE